MLAALCSERPDDEGCGRLAHDLDFRTRRAADGQRRRFCFGQMAIQRIADVGHDDGAQAESLDPVLDRLDVARRQHRRSQHIDLLRPLAGALAFRHQRLDQRLDGQRVAAFQAADVIRRIDRHHGDVGELRMRGAELAQAAANVGALRFRKAGRQQADDVRLALVAQRAQRFDDVLVGAHDARHLIHRRRLQRNRLAEMAHEEHLAEGRAALRAMHQRHGCGRGRGRPAKRRSAGWP